MRPEELTIVFKLDTFKVGLALQSINAVLTKHHIPLRGFRADGKPVNLATVVKVIKKPHFQITGRGFEFLLGIVRNYQLDFLGIKSVHEHEIDWNEWVEQFIGDPNFVMAWLADCEYHHWQNAYDPLQYTAVGRSYAHLPMKSNGLPYPLEQKIIDTSANPGRWRLCKGYHEAVAAVMWLGEPFWELTGTDKSKVEKADWLQISHPVPPVIKVQAANECFTTAEGANGELQQRLRTLLFGSLNKCSNQ
jgi:hypothetical protein